MIEEEIIKCQESPAYFFNKYAVIKDKDGNILEKPVLTDELIRIRTDQYQQWMDRHFRGTVSPEQYRNEYNKFLKISEK